jgi:hypothetical protein
MQGRGGGGRRGSQVYGLGVERVVLGMGWLVVVVVVVVVVE